MVACASLLPHLMIMESLFIIQLLYQEIMLWEVELIRNKMDVCASLLPHFAFMETFLVIRVLRQELTP